MGRPKGSTNIPWGSIVARLRKHPGRWMLLPEMRRVPDRTIATIRRRERRELRLDDGVIRCRRRATVWLEDGTVRCILILKFEERKAPDASES
ncbi:hypothetical protein SEA_ONEIAGILLIAN_76 [Microbacterium phage OneinaGillian]|uniref:Uncharacterized protein n=1 Tax=Microbacterium phage OneinaGillian TaxID=2301604 RepID=A0A385UGC0_9CAUD|nr:hypothetical protein HOU23_gp076 [Microbacterium phage OneinaGillian]QJD53299.1 hypothetical protein SEA_TEMPO_78 [Microbacterium phage Tempo]UOW92822.1 hypothetical protein SEA_ROBINROSE_79 [Microbacterium phage RobinRose]WNN94103.1 hypothetical protein SEA_FREGLEY_78 [Microbacterium phage Fregley]WNT44286.1 hypothetical protein SEA_CANDC_75 [Microbacterium phage CandC]AYB70186.1 hypothetical protein SEA_ONEIAGILLIAN_76 [Microbacterium phage OneinaGillian]